MPPLRINAQVQRIQTLRHPGMLCDWTSAVGDLANKHREDQTHLINTDTFTSPSFGAKPTPTSSFPDSLYSTRRILDTHHYYVSASPFILKSSSSLEDPPRFLQSPVRARSQVTADIETLTLRTRRTRRLIRQRQRDRQPSLTGVFPKPRDLRGEGEEKRGEEAEEEEGNTAIEATKIEIDSDDNAAGTGVAFTGIFKLFSWSRGGDTETASLQVSSIPRTPTRRMKRPFELTVPPATAQTPRRFDNGSEDKDREIPPMPSTPIKDDLAIAVRKEEREEEREMGRQPRALKVGRE
ncbi:hypothetical protein V5O48_018231 [Marasmius crinis-equi]|uniref:Uncharacterized protein n=1 Tax=Marasmius crinis-equi TaxID=585013 RepID=A0ABR3ELR5_9AGAR